MNSSNSPSIFSKTKSEVVTHSLAKEMAFPLLLFVFSLFFWESIILLPVKILTIFFHELSHGIAAILTGGSIQKIVLTIDGGGVCYTIGGNQVIILTAGYLGSLLWGATLFLIAVKTNFDQIVVGLLGALLIGVTLIYVRSFIGFLFGIIFGVGMIIFAKKFGATACDQLLRYLGLTSCFYVLLDIKSDLIEREIPGSDANRLAGMIGLPGWTIGILWMIIALYIVYNVMKMSITKHLIISKK